MQVGRDIAADPSRAPAASTDPTASAVQRPGATTPATDTSDGRGAGPRIAYLSFSSGVYDARTLRMARSAIAAGYRVTVYARWEPDLPPIEERDGYRLIRVPWDWQLVIPGLRGGARRRNAAAMARAATEHAGEATGGADADDDQTGDDADDGVEGSGDNGDPGIADATSGGAVARVVDVPRQLLGRIRRRVFRAPRRWWRLTKSFPLRPLGWASALEDVAEPADIWHGMWAGSLPALERMRRRHGGRTIYDSRDVYMESRDFAKLGWPAKAILERLERRWARAADTVLTVNEPYADLIARGLGVARPRVVMNCPEIWQPPEPRPDLIRATLGLPSSTAVVLYQGHLMSERGIEQTMDAILEVPDAILGLLGFGTWLDRLTEQVAEPPYLGRVMLLDPVPPTELLEWTASADVTVMAIQPTTLNHRYTTPQKLFESIAAGVPVVAADLPGMAGIVRSSGVGLVCDPTSSTAIAEAIRELLSTPPDERLARQARVLEVAHERYNWEIQAATLLDLYRELIARSPRTTAATAR
jgi:glycosyltransferase involved in cell wall biosynthesis